MQVSTRNPQFKLRIVSKRWGVIPEEDLRANVSQMSVGRKIGEEAGSFSISFLAKEPPHRYGVKSWADVIEPMDYVEITCWVPPRRADRPLMRGFVDTVGKTFAIASGNPDQAVELAGRDWGKLALITKLYYIGDQLPEALVIFNKWRDGFNELFHPSDEDPEARAYFNESTFFVTPRQVMTVVYRQFFKPQEEAVLGTFDQDIPPSELVVSVDPKIEDSLRSYNPQFSHQSWQPMSEVWSLWRSYQHAPWRELYFDEGPSSSRLIYRDTPWLDRAGEPIQGFGNQEPVHTVECSLQDRIDWGLFRSDERVQNFFFTYPSQFGAITALAKTQGTLLEGMYASPLFQSNPYLVGVDAETFRGIGAGSLAKQAESAYQRHGVRAVEVSTPYLNVDRVAAAAQQLAIRSIREQGVSENLRLARAMDHGALLEFGNIRIRGDERFRIGSYLRFTEDGAQYYVTGVSHSFRQGSQPGDGHFVTSLTVERGRGHIVRAGLGK